MIMVLKTDFVLCESATRSWIGGWWVPWDSDYGVSRGRGCWNRMKQTPAVEGG